MLVQCIGTAEIWFTLAEGSDQLRFLHGDSSCLLSVWLKCTQALFLLGHVLRANAFQNTMGITDNYKKHVFFFPLLWSCSSHFHGCVGNAIARHCFFACVSYDYIHFMVSWCGTVCNGAWSLMSFCTKRVPNWPIAQDQGHPVAHCLCLYCLFSNWYLGFTTVLTVIGTCMHAVFAGLIWPDAHWSSRIGKKLLKIHCSESLQDQLAWGMVGHARDVHTHTKHAW